MPDLTIKLSPKDVEFVLKVIEGQMEQERFFNHNSTFVRRLETVYNRIDAQTPLPPDHW